jgi:hypothetical protein
MNENNNNSNSNSNKTNVSNKFLLFEGYDRNSTRYQTKRGFELEDRKEKVIQHLELLETILANPTLSEDEIDIYEKRYRSLKKLLKLDKKKDLNQLFIPFRIDGRTVVYIREKNCMKNKWVKLIGKKRIEKTIKEYKAILHKKPEGVIYWNPFFE